MAPGSFDTLGDVPTEDGRGQEGKLLAGRYRILRKLGEGGMGLVYLAEDRELANHQVAIKFIPPMLAGSARAIKNLQREALTAMQLTHPNIVRLHDLHTDGHQKFLVMEYVAGKTLDDLLAQEDSGKISLEALLPIADQVAAALDHAHSQNVLHRDLKPSNIMVADDGTVRLLDFGIAREMKDSYTRVTGQETSGTLPYMSPEQLMGERPSPAMDVYSFGAVLYECLTGHPPFYTGDIREQIKTKSPGPIEGVGSWVNEVLLSALSKKAAKRPHLACDLVSRLKNEPHAVASPHQEEPKVPEIEVPASLPITAPVASQPASGPKTKRLWGWLVALIALVCGGVCTLYGLLTQPSSAPLGSPPNRSLEWQTSIPVAESASIPGASDLIRIANAQYAPLGGLASGSREAQTRQRQAVSGLNLPLEVKTIRTGIVFRLIPAGDFTMGSPSGESDRMVDETEYQVTLTKSFYCGKYEVTQGQWEQVMGSNPSHFKNAGRDAPVEQVSWEDCQAFLKKLCQIEGVPEGTYRLLTEAQWEYACRSGSASRFCFGDSDSSLGQYAWYDSNSGSTTQVVGQKRPNGWGLYNMHGNVLEWCQDWYGYYPSDTVTDPLGPASGEYRVARGGSWDFIARYCRSADRGMLAPGDRHHYLGLRLARTTPSYP